MRTAASILPALLLVACGASATSSPESSALDKSLQTWANTKNEGASYEYGVPGGSFSGIGSLTTMTVRSDRVVARSYSSTTPDASGKPVPGESWSETGAEVGSHTGVAKPRLIEELYAQCSNEVLTQDRGANDVFVAFDSRGLLQTCVYVPKGCQDDCSFGVEIRNLTIAK